MEASMGAGDAWEALLERSISAFYEDQFPEGRLACERLLCLPDLPANVRAVTRTNQVHYARHIDEIAASYRRSTISRSLLPEAAWHASWAELNPDDAAFRSLQTLTGHADEIDWEPWLSVLIDDAIYIMSSLGPTVAVRCDLKTVELALAAFHDAPLVAQDLHGGSQLIDSGDGFLAIVYDVVTWDNGEQTAIHRFVRFDRSFQMTHLSHPFRLPGTGVARACELAREGDELALTYGFDRECTVASLDLAEALTLLQPIEHLSPHGTHPFPMPEELLATLQRWDSPMAPDVGVVDLESVLVLRPETVIDAMPRQAQA
jgi:hypothetical protein